MRRGQLQEEAAIEHKTQRSLDGATHAQAHATLAQAIAAVGSAIVQEARAEQRAQELMPAIGN